METTERKIYECLAKIAKMDRIVLLLSTPVPTPDLLLEFLESVVSVERKKRCAPQVNKEPEVRLHVLKAADSLMSVQRTGRANRPKALTQNSWSDKNLSDSIASTRRPVLSMRRPNSRLCLSLLVCFLASTAPVSGEDSASTRWSSNLSGCILRRFFCLRTQFLSGLFRLIPPSLPWRKDFEVRLKPRSGPANRGSLRHQSNLTLLSS